jgi:hypothetical protein
VTFKSHQEALDNWALHELIGHYVNYRKQVSPAPTDLLPETDFRLFAVCVRSPHNLARLVPPVTLTPVRPGVHELYLAARCIRVIVVHELPQEEQNAMLLLFSARDEPFRYGQEHYRPRSPQTSTLLYQLWKTYSEDPDVTNQLQEFLRQNIDELLRTLPPEKRMEGLSPEERVEGLSAEELARAIPPETLEALLRQCKTNGSSPKSE